MFFILDRYSEWVSEFSRILTLLSLFLETKMVANGNLPLLILENIFLLFQTENFESYISYSTIQNTHTPYKPSLYVHTHTHTLHSC